MSKDNLVTLKNLGRKAKQDFPISQAVKLLRLQANQRVKTFELDDENYQFVSDEIVRRTKDGTPKKSKSESND